MTAVLTSFRTSIALMLGARVVGAFGGLLFSQVWQSRPVLAAAHAAPSAQALLTTNLRGAAVVGLVSAMSGGVGGLLFNFSDGFRYGLAISGGAVAAPAHGLPSGLAAVAFPWLEFLAVSFVAAGASVLFWRAWFGRQPLLRPRPAVAVVIAIVASLIVAAQMEASLLQ
ncbi:MAG TPA: hypothetical protein VGU71_02135 [Candidatus Dormibacteraeota bacterium]|nr:hypothetical protein [Candidatus Dormibacteraeota bacterium]